jgi:hypothetical protein
MNRKITVLLVLAFFSSGCFLSPEYYQGQYASITFSNAEGFVIDEGALPQERMVKIGSTLSLDEYNPKSMVAFGKTFIGWAAAEEPDVQLHELVVDEQTTLIAIWEDTTTYALGDRGPEGGWIFKIDSGTYYESAREDTTRQTWTELDTAYGEDRSDGLAIPTRELLQDMYTVLYTEGLGRFSPDTYWSSDTHTLDTQDFSYTVDFGNDGFFALTHPENKSLARPYRTFTL